MRKIYRTFDLPVITGRGKSYYGKARVEEYDNGDRDLISYATTVCRIHNGKLQKLWDGYSATTMRHINSFIDLYGFDGGGKSWWENLKML